MTTTIRATGPQELLSYVPYRLGYRPHDSVVAIGLAGRRGEVGLVARADMTDLADPARGAALAATLVSHLCQDGADRAVLVAYAGHDVGEARERAAAAIRRLVGATSGVLPAPEVWVVAETGYACASCGTQGCCPVGGRPLVELESTVVGARMVLAGSAPAASRADSYRIEPVGPDASRSARRAAARWRVRGARELASSVHRHQAWRAGGLATWRQAVATATGPDRGVVGSALVGRLGAALVSVPVRDAVLLSLVPGADRLADRTALGSPRDDLDAGTARAIAAIVDPVEGVEPDVSVTAPARVVLESVVAHAPEPGSAAPLTLLALIAWWHGDGGLARERLEAALEVEPTYRLALLIESALAAGLPPGWIRRGR